MLRESQHTRFEDQILGQISLRGRPASCASLADILYIYIDPIYFFGEFLLIYEFPRSYIYIMPS